MQQLIHEIAANHESQTANGFWRGQFQPEVTKSQRRFDWIFGVVMPVLCIFVDPLVFRGGFEVPLLGRFKPFFYTLSFVAVLALSAWLIWGAKLKWLNAILSGLFAVGSIASLAIGIVLSPFSTMGLVILIGALGFTPLVTSIVFSRNAVRAFQTTNPFLETRTLFHSFVVSALFFVAIPFVINAEIEKSLDRIYVGDAATFRYESQKLRYVAPLVDFEQLNARLPLRFETTSEERVSDIQQFYVEMKQKSVLQRLFD